MKYIRCVALLLTIVFLLCACSQPSSDPAASAAPTWREQYDLGVRYLGEGNYQEAIIAFNAAIEIDPRNADAYLGLADVYIAIDDAEAAKAALQQGLDATDDERLRERLDALSSDILELPYYEVIFEFANAGGGLAENHFTGLWLTSFDLSVLTENGTFDSKTIAVFSEAVADGRLPLDDLGRDSLESDVDEFLSIAEAQQLGILRDLQVSGNTVRFSTNVDVYHLHFNFPFRLYDGSMTEGFAGLPGSRDGGDNHQIITFTDDTSYEATVVKE